MNDAPDPRPLITAALDQTGRLVGEVGADDLDRPTPCDDWDVRALLAHLLAVENRIALIMGGADHADLPRALDPPEGDWAAGWAQYRSTVDEILSDDAVLTRVVHHPAGDMPGARALFVYVSELATHAWDLAAALGRTDKLDPTIAGAVLQPIKAALPADWRGPEVPFGEVVAVPDDASTYEQLVGWLGRDPQWRA